MKDLDLMREEFYSALNGVNDSKHYDELTIAMMYVYHLEANQPMTMLAQDIVRWRKLKGFETPSSFSDAKGLLAKLMLVVSEVGEAAEAVRKDDYDNFKEEIADTIIRLLDICGSLSMDIDKEVNHKMYVNEGREHMHGKRA